jgi:ATP-binding cassette, subfamily B, bacterial
MLPAVRTLGQAAEAWVGARVARDRLVEFVGQETPVRAHAEVAGSRPALELAAPHWHGRVAGPSARVPYGRRIAIVGPPDAGKSSMLQLLAGRQCPDSGSLRLGGADLHALAPGQLRRHLALLSPDLPLLRGTVADNVRYQARTPGALALARALTLSGLERLLPGLPDGLDTRVRDAGANLSHGQRRAVLLARCLAARPSVLLIDDPSACLPGQDEERLGQLLDEFHGTLIYATCDPALAALADEVWHFDDGRCCGGWAVRPGFGQSLSMGAGEHTRQAP